MKAELPPSSDVVDVFHDADDMASYLSDASGETADQPPVCVARPRNTEELAAFMSQCHRWNQAVCIQGGLTGLAGGAVPAVGEAVVALERMN